jgi:hypothetical protein
MPSAKELREQLKIQKEVMSAHNETSKSYQQAQKEAERLTQEIKTQVGLERDITKVIGKSRNLAKEFEKSKKETNVIAAKTLGILNDNTRLSIQNQRSLALANDTTKESINLASVLTELAQIEQEVRDNIKDGLDEEITKADILVRLNEEKLDLARKALEGEEGDFDLDQVIDDISKVSKKASESSGFIKDLGGGFDAIKGLLPAIGGVFAFIVAQAVDFAKRTMETRKELGLSLVTSAKLAGQQKLLGTFAKAFGQDAESVAQIQKDILGNLGGQAKLSKELVMDFIMLQGTLGVTSDTASKLIPILDSVGAAGERGAVAQIESLGALIQLEGLSPGQILGDVASNTEFFAKFAKDGGTNLVRAAVSARKLGLELSAVASITESLLDFETSIEKQLEASLLLGRQINLDRARQLALTGDQEGLLEEVRRQVGDEAEFNRLNVVQRKALADAFGLQVEQVARAVRGNTAAVTGAAAAGGGDELQRTSVNLLGDIARNTGKFAGAV